MPSNTSGGYDWTRRFLYEYGLRRKGVIGKMVMGMIFRIDTHGYLSSSAVNAITASSVSGVIESPELLPTYSWRRRLPTMALNVRFTKEEW